MIQPDACCLLRGCEHRRFYHFLSFEEKKKKKETIVVFKEREETHSKVFGCTPCEMRYPA